MLDWSNTNRIQKIGIKKAKRIKSVYVFILPVLPANSKSIWENCAKVLVDKSNEELQPYLIKLFEWLKDMNWPGADLIFNRLILIPKESILPAYKYCASLAEKTDDFAWNLSLKHFNEQYNRKKMS